VYLLFNAFFKIVSRTGELTVVHISVIGIGNEARGDDAVGLEVARRLQPDAPAGVQVDTVQGGGLSLLERWQGADAVIIIDASYSGTPPGSIHRLEPLKQEIPKALYLCSTHAFGVGEAIELARVLEQLPAHLVVYGIEGARFDLGRGLSNEVRRAVPDVIRQVQQDIAAFQIQAMSEDHHA
jgi:hydrogenase maturation protease